MPEPRSVHLHRSPLLAGIAGLVLLAGCTVGPDYERPQTELPARWSAAPSANVTDEAVDAAAMSKTSVQPDWWRRFDDPVLTALVERALTANEDIQLAAARVAEARANLSFTRADRLPSLGAEASASRVRSSGDLTSPTVDRTANDFRLASVLSYEVDLWGRLARSNEAARATLLSTRAARDAVRLAVASDTALTYFNLRSLDEQLAIAERTVTSRSESLDLQQSQFDAGAVTELELRQAQAELAAAQAQVPQLRRARDEQVNALAVLLGSSPRAIIEDAMPRGLEIDQLPVPPLRPDQQPAALLERRPDIRDAEQQLRAANAEIGVARAAYFPTLSLSALLGLESLELDRLFSGGTGTWQLLGNSSAPIFDFGRTEANVRAAEARREQAQSTYRGTVRTAFREVADAVGAQQTTTERLEAETRQVQTRRDTLRLARRRYDAGYSSYLEVLDAQRTLFQSELDRVTAQSERLAATVDLYKALGGGWTADAP